MTDVLKTLHIPPVSRAPNRMPIRDSLANDQTIDFRRVFITHSPSEEGLVRFAIDTVKSYGLFREVLETMAGCTVCTHCGPDTLGILFMRK